MAENKWPIFIGLRGGRRCNCCKQRGYLYTPENKGFVEQQMLTGGSPLHGADARGRLAPANRFHLVLDSELIVRLLRVIIGKTAGSIFGGVSSG
jgi:hypothetical protein